MASSRTPTLSTAVRTPGQPDVCYKVASDWSVWMVTMAATATWQKLPAIPSAGGATPININAARYPGMVDTIYCDMSDGTSWMCTVGSPAVWSQLTTIPQPSVVP